MRTVGQLWLLAHRVTIDVAGIGHVALLPLGLLALPAYAVMRAGTWLVHYAEIEDMRGAVTGGLTLGACYAVIGAIVATVAASDTVTPSTPQALIATGIIGVVFGVLGALRGSGQLEAVWHAVPPRAMSVLVGAGAAAGTVLVVGALLVVGSLLAHPTNVIDIGRSLHPGPVGALVLVLACLAYVPNAVVWAAAFVVGPGFAVGAGTSVSPLSVKLGALPAFPLLGALPAPGTSPLYVLPVVLVPLAAGALGGVLLIRRLPTLRLEDAAAWGFAAGALGGIALGVLAAVTSGPIGSGRLAAVGPSAWQVGVAAALEIGLASAVAAAIAQRRILAVV
jgi:hypothetical protein